MARLCGGDTSLIPMIEQANASITPEAREIIMQGVVVAPVQISTTEKRCREAGMLLDLEERKIKIQEANFSFQLKRMKLINEIIPLDDRDKLYFKDVLKMCGNAGYAAITDTPDEERGREISIALVAQEIGVNPNGQSPVIGKLMAKRWKDAHPGEEPSKRDTLYQGRPYKENAYFQRDYVMLEACIRECLVAPKVAPSK